MSSNVDTDAFVVSHQGLGTDTKITHILIQWAYRFIGIDRKWPLLVAALCFLSCSFHAGVGAELRVQKYTFGVSMGEVISVYF